MIGRLYARFCGWRRGCGLSFINGCKSSSVFFLKVFLWKSEVGLVKLVKQI